MSRNSCIAPYLLSYFPAPGGGRIALAIARIDGVGGIELRLRDVDSARDLRFEYLAALKPVLFSWAADGAHLAVGQDSHTDVWDIAGPSHVSRLHGRCLGFDRFGAVWMHSSSGQLLRALSPFRRPEFVDDSVVAACSAPSAAWICRAAADAALEVCRPDCAPMPWPLPVRVRPRVQTDIEGRVFVSAEDSDGDARRLRIAHWGTDCAEQVVLDQVVGLPLGRTVAPWMSWRRGEVLFLRRQAMCSELHVSVGWQGTRRVSPDGFHVHEFTGSPATGRVAMVGHDYASQDPSLFVLEESGEEWRAISLGPSQGAPVFDESGAVLLTPSPEAAVPCVWRPTRESDEPWQRHGAAAPPPAHAPALLATREVLCVGRLGGTGYVGRQANFFQHALWGIAVEVAAAIGAQAVQVGSLLPVSNEPRFVDAVASLDNALRARTEAAVVLVCGSLGAAYALRASKKYGLKGQILISPVYSPWVSGLTAWSDVLGNDDGWDCVRLAEASRTPTLVIHGLRDEVSAYSQTNLFALRASANVPVKPVQLVEEGHVFACPASWREAIAEARAFALAQFASEGVG